MPTFTQPKNAVQPTPLIAGNCSVPAKLFGFRPEGLSAWQLVCGTRGVGKLIYPGGNREINVGDLVLFAPGAMQRYGNPTTRPWVHIFVIFHAGPDWQRWMNWPEVTPGVGFFRPQRDAVAIHRALRQAVQLQEEMHRYKRELALDLVHQALIRCHADLHSQDEPEMEPRLVKWIEAVGKDMGKSHLPIHEMAGQVGMSPSQLARTFHRQLGMSPARYFEKMRIEHGAALLSATTMRVREVAETLGYDDPLYFSTRFRDATGMSPRGYRRQMEIERRATPSTM